MLPIDGSLKSRAYDVIVHTTRYFITRSSGLKFQYVNKCNRSKGDFMQDMIFILLDQQVLNLSSSSLYSPTMVYVSYQQFCRQTVPHSSGL